MNKQRKQNPQPIPRSCVPSLEANWEMDIQPKPLFDRRVSTSSRYSVDGSTLGSYPQERIDRSLMPKTAIYQLVTKIYITNWQDGFIWINPCIQQNYAGKGLYPQIQEHKVTYVPILFHSIERIIHIEAEPFNTKADLLLGMRFLTETTYSIIDKVLTIKINGAILQAIRIHD